MLEYVLCVREAGNMKLLAGSPNGLAPIVFTLSSIVTDRGLIHSPFPSPLSIVRLTTPIAESLSLRTLPLHLHEILPAFALYHFLDLYISPTFSRRLFPQTYKSLPERSQKNWNAHVVSLVQATIINSAALWVIYADKERWAMGPAQRVWGYTGSMGMVQALSAGYFLWDLMAASSRPDVHGYGAIAHAASALAVSMFGFVCKCTQFMYRSTNINSARSATTMVSTLCCTSYPRLFSISTGLWTNWE